MNSIQKYYAKPGMNPVITTKGIVFSVILVASQLVVMKEGKAQDRCQAAIEGVRSDIQGRIGAVTTVGRFSTAEFRGSSESMETYQSPFNNADEIIIFSLKTEMDMQPVSRKQDRAGYNIMNSPKLTRTYAQKIISDCEPVASVKFSYWEWTQGWSLNKDNELVEDKCKNSDGNLYWGQNLCV